MHYETTMYQVGNNTGIPVPTDILDALGGGRRPAVAVKVTTSSTAARSAQ